MKSGYLYKFCIFLLAVFIITGLSCTIGENSPNEPEEEPIAGETIPVVTTRSVSDITYNSAKSGGEIALDLKNEIIDRGICWSTQNPPTPEDHRTFNGTGPGNFSSNIDGLVAGTKYYVQAFATSNAGTGYGEIVSFSTSSDSNRASYTDPEGNEYPLVKINGQWWMAKNLMVTQYRNGDPIPQITDGTEWSEQTDGALCLYENTADFKDPYGMMYNWQAVNDERGLAPEGWHIPTDEEWKTLEMFLGMSDIEANMENWRGTHTEGNMLKDDVSDDWIDYYTNLDNSNGFSALPGGYRVGPSGEFLEKGFYAVFWTSTASTDELAYNRTLHLKNSKIGRFKKDKKEGVSVRCIMD